MKISKLKEILSLSEDPLWMTRDFDSQKIQSEGPALPQLPGQQQPQQPAPNSKAMTRMADKMIFGEEGNPGSETSANPVTEGGSGVTLSDNIKLRKMMRQQNPTFPGKVGMAQGGY